MNKDKLNMILKNHEKELGDEKANLRCSDLSDTNIRDVGLEGAFVSNKNKIIEFKDLVGEHILSGVEFGVCTVQPYDNYGVNTANYTKFTLDGITYRAIEDADDGYRSVLDYIEITHETCKVKLPDIEIYIREIANKEKKSLYFKDKKNDKTVLEIGTNYIDSYYPVCIMSYVPENFSCNEIRN